MTNITLTEAETYHVKRLRAYYPYRNIFICILNDVREIICPKDRRYVNKIIRNGGHVFKIEK
jgi:hypothetical protein